MANPYDDFDEKPTQITGPNPLRVGQVQGQALDNTGQGLSNTKASIDIQNAPIERTGKILGNTGQQLGNQRTAQDIQFDRTKLALDLRGKFESDPSVQKYRQALPELAGAMKAPDTAQGDLSLVYAFGKTMDPGSVVREGELDMAQGTSGLKGQLKSYLGILDSGKRLPPETRAKLIDAMRNRVIEYNKGYSQVYNQYSNLAKQGGFNPAEVIGNHDGDAFRSTEMDYLKPAKVEDADRILQDMFERQRPAAEIRARMDELKYDLPKWQEGMLDQYEAARAGGKLTQVEVRATDQPDTGMGILKGAIHPWDRAAVGLENGINAITGWGLDDAHQSQAQHNAYFAGQNVSPGGVTLGKAIGAGLLTAPLPGGAIVQGAVGNVLAGDSTDTTGIATDAVVGGAVGYGAGKVLGAGQKLLNPQVPAPLKRLADEGAFIPPAQMLGPQAAMRNEMLRSNPVLGPRIDALNQRAVESVNRIPANRALGKIGQELPESVPAGHQAVDYTRQALSGEFNNAARGTEAVVDLPLLQRLNYFGERGGLRPQEFDQFNDIVQREVGGAFMNGGGRMSGRDFLRLNEKLGDYTAGFKASDDPFQRQLGEGTDFLQDQMNALFRRQNPEQAETLRAARDGWKTFVPYRTAASKSVEDGLFSPGQLRQAVRQSDRSVGKGRTAEGKAELQDLASDASELLNPIRGNSGTADRQQANSLRAYLLGKTLQPLYSDAAQDTISQILLRDPGTLSKVSANALGTARRRAVGGVLPLLIPRD